MDNYGESFQGRRKNNQDCFLIYEHDEQTVFLAVADGMGGMVGGEIASELVIETAKNIIIESFDEQVNQSNLKQILNKIYSKAQESIRERVNQEPDLEGMGTTLTCVLIHQNCFVWGNIGDSRVYIFKEHGFQLITNDHKYVDYLISDENEVLSKALINRYGHLLTRSINGGEDIPDLYPKKLPWEKIEVGEGFLLCSDGLLLDKYGKEISILDKILLKSDSIKEFVDNLISNAYSMGSNDNITCVALWNGWHEYKNNFRT